MKIKITSDSTCDLGEKLIKENDIGIFALQVILGEQSYSDGVNIVPQDIFDYVAANGTLPKTAAGSSDEYSAFFKEQLEGYDALIHFNISSKASSSHSAALIAAKSFGGKVFVIDSKALSTGQGLLVMKACDMRKEGLSAEEIAKRMTELTCFITHSSADKSLVDIAKREVAQMFEFDEVIETVAGSIITSHCGRNTLGVLFIAE